MMTYTDSLELEHFGVKGMKWGVRRYQNADGTLTAAGKDRLAKYKFKEENRVNKQKTSYQNAVNRRAKRRAKTGALQKPKDKAAEKKRIEDFKKELSVIKKLKYSDMEKELKAKRKANTELIAAQMTLGILGTVVTSALQEIDQSGPESSIRKLRLELYDELNKR